MFGWFVWGVLSISYENCFRLWVVLWVWFGRWWLVGGCFISTKSAIGAFWSITSLSVFLTFVLLWGWVITWRCWVTRIGCVFIGLVQLPSMISVPFPCLTIVDLVLTFILHLWLLWFWFTFELVWDWAFIFSLQIV